MGIIEDKLKEVSERNGLMLHTDLTNVIIPAIKDEKARMKAELVEDVRRLAEYLQGGDVEPPEYLAEVVYGIIPKANLQVMRKANKEFTEKMSALAEQIDGETKKDEA